MALVLSPTKKCTLKFADDNSKTARFEAYTAHANTDPSGVPYINLANLTQIVSAVEITEVQVSLYAEESAPGAPSDGPFASGLDKMQLEFVGEDGSPVKYNFPSPLEGNFIDNSCEVDAADVNVAALIAYIIANCKTAEGTDIAAYSGGERRSPPRVKRGL